MPLIFFLAINYSPTDWNMILFCRHLASRNVAGTFKDRNFLKSMGIATIFVRGQQNLRFVLICIDLRGQLPPAPWLCSCSRVGSADDLWFMKSLFISILIHLLLFPLIQWTWSKPWSANGLNPLAAPGNRKHLILHLWAELNCPLPSEQ